MWHCYLDVLSFIHNLFYWFNFFVSIFLYLCCTIALLQCSTVTCTFLYSHIIYFNFFVSLFLYLCCTIALLQCSTVICTPSFSYSLHWAKSGISVVQYWWRILKGHLISKIAFPHYRKFHISSTYYVGNRAESHVDFLYSIHVMQCTFPL